MVLSFQIATVINPKRFCNENWSIKHIYLVTCNFNYLLTSWNRKLRPQFQGNWKNKVSPRCSILSTIKTREKKKNWQNASSALIGILFQKLFWTVVKKNVYWLRKLLKIQGKSFWPVVWKKYSSDREKLLKIGGKRSKICKMLRSKEQFTRN